MFLLIPGRHHLLTEFQKNYLSRILAGELEGGQRIEGVVWAVTSANHSNTRRNPLPANRREAAIEAFSQELAAPSYVYLIDDVGHSRDFAEYVIKKVGVESNGRLKLAPENTLIACSTPEVIELYERLGFRVLPVELEDRAARRFKAETPWQVLMRLVKAGEEGRDWRGDEDFSRLAAGASRRLYERYGFGELVQELHRHPVLTEDGDLTLTRDYNTYVRSFDDGAERKYELVKDHVVPGRIVDIGCCTGALLRLLTRDERLRESDFYGVEVARPLYAECVHRKERGDFANDNVFFYQADAVRRRLFSPRTLNTVTTFALTHELESYQGRQTLEEFIGNVGDQLSEGGVWINVDVVGPEEKEEEVWLWLNREDGVNEGWDKSFAEDRAAFRAHLDGLSSYGRFLRFARDFRKQENDGFTFSVEEKDGQSYVRLRLRDACEFMSKKDYTDNWTSEMHETFCFWSFSDWRSAVESRGFSVHPASRAYTNPWIVKNRFEGKVRLFRSGPRGLEPMEYPVTNMLLVARRRLRA